MDDRAQPVLDDAGPLPRPPPPGEHDDPQGWRKFSAAYWRDDWEGFAEFFFSQCFSEPHSTKQREDAVGWALETTPDVMLTEVSADQLERETVLGWAERHTQPALVIHGDDDRISPLSRGEALAEATGGELVVLEGAGHIPVARDPVKVNRLVIGFVRRVTGFTPQPFSWTRGKSRRRRALWISSPIGLGHARRDIATAQALRQHHPDLQIDRLAQHPVTTVLEEAGETVHPASRHLSSTDFMVFHDVVDAEPYDLVVGDEAWDVDYFLHENPELKRFVYAWSTDFVGWLPMESGGDRERFLTADYNAEMIEHIDRYPRIRDAALFVGNPEDGAGRAAATIAELL